MTTSLRHFVLLVAIISFSALSAQRVFRKAFTGFEINNWTQIAAYPSGGYALVVEEPNPTLPNYEHIIIMRYDSCDHLMWSKRYENAAAQLQLSDMSITRNDEILIIGYPSDVTYHTYLMKVKPNGEVAYSVKYEWPFSHYAYTIREDVNGDYFMFGNVYMNNGTEHRNYVSKVRSDGSLIWTKGYFDIPIWGRGEVTSDGGFITHSGSTNYKIDGQGNLLWAREISEPLYYTSVPEEVTDGYIFVRYPYTNNLDPLSYLIKYDFNGNVLWTGERFYSYQVNEVDVVSDGGFVVTGHVYIDTIPTPAEYTCVTRLDAHGKVMSQKVLDVVIGEVQKSTDIVVTSNNQVYVCGWIESPLLPQNHLYLQKTNAALEMGACTDWSFRNVKPAVLPTFTPKTVTPIDIVFTAVYESISVDNVDPKELTYCNEPYPSSIELGKDTVVCANDTLMIGLSGFEFPWYHWSTGETSKMIQVKDSGTYILTVGVGCEQLSDTIHIGYFPGLEPTYTVTPEEIFPGRPVRIESTNQKIVAGCFYPEGTSRVCERILNTSFQENGIHKIGFNYQDSNGCWAWDSLEIELNFHTFYMPNAFSPNGDGLNDYFGPEGFGIVSYQLQIFNSWGELLFEGFDVPWDGTSRGRQAAPDTYVYKISILRDDGKKIRKEGSLQLF